MTQPDLLAALQASIDRHKATVSQAQAAQEPRSAPPEGEDTGETAQGESAPYGWPTMTPARLFHGGVPGLRLGDRLTGGHERRMHDGCAWCVARANGTAEHDPASHHPDRVYVSTDREYARFYASLYGYGDLYRVEPIGELVPSDEDGFPSWTAESVRVVGVVARAVRLTDGERRRLLRRWTALDYRGTALSALVGSR